MGGFDGPLTTGSGLIAPVVRAERGAGGFVTKWLRLEAVDATARSANEYRGAEGGPSALTLVASVEAEDRAGDLIEAAGWELESYGRNPVVLWAHDYLRPPIGRSLRTWVEGRSLMATIEFAPMPFAQEVRALYAGGFMRGVSVGFRALESEARPDSGQVSTGSRSRPGRRGLVFKRQELLEISAAPVPLNAMALAVQEAQGDLGDGNREGSECTEAMRMLKEIARLWRELVS